MLVYVKAGQLVTNQLNYFKKTAGDTQCEQRNKNSTTIKDAYREEIYLCTKEKMDKITKRQDA